MWRKNNYRRFWCNTSLYKFKKLWIGKSSGQLDYKFEFEFLYVKYHFRVRASNRFSTRCLYLYGNIHLQTHSTQLLMWIIYKWWKVLLLCKHGRTIFYSEFNWRNEIAVIVLLHCRRSDAPLPIYKDKPYARIDILFDVSIWRYSSENSYHRRSNLMPQAKEYKNVLWIYTILEN